MGLLGTVTRTAPRAERQEREGTDEPRLHAFPHGSSVALCGKTRKPGEEQATATSFCRACEGLASSVAHRG